MARKTSAKSHESKPVLRRGGRSSKPKGPTGKVPLKPKPAKAKVVASQPRLTKSPLNRKELQEFRDLLLEKRRQLLGDMSGMQAEAFRSKGQDESSDLSTMPVHMADVGTDNYEQEFTLGLLESERRLLRDIDEALDRIDRGSFGICVGTGQAIGVPRLRAKPWAKYCIEYARLIEQGLVKRPATSLDSSGDSEDGEPGEDHDDFDEDEEEEVEVAAEGDDGAVQEEDEDLD